MNAENRLEEYIKIKYRMDADIFLIKNGVKYFKKPDGTIVSAQLPQEGKIGGQDEINRNSLHNPTRLARILTLNSIKVADFGAGNGLFVKYLISNGIDAIGYDKYNPLMSEPLENNKYDLITAIEVLEHTSEPYSEIDEIFNALKPGCILMVEMSFIDWMNEDDPYINPELGHSTIFSHKGLDNLMISKGFEIGNHINKNVRIYNKPINL